MNLTELFVPNAKPGMRSVTIAALSCLGLMAWEFLRPTVFPSPLEVIGAIPTLWTDGIVWDLFSSLTVCMEALALSAIVGLPIAYLSRVPVVEPIATFLSKLRFAGAAVFYLPLLMTMTPHSVKVALLMLGELFYLVTTMQGVVLNISQERFDDAATLKMSPWKSVWFVVIRGTVPEALTAIKDNNGMGLASILFVEGIVRSEGGVGVRLFEAERYSSYDQFFAIVILIVLTGIASDWALRQLRKAACPYGV